MQKNQSVTIERVGNGYVVRPAFSDNLGRMTLMEEVLVFQDMGWASAQRDNQPSEACLLGFIEAHFSGVGDK